MSEQPSALGEFKDFVLRGNVVDLAVAVVIAMFFGAVVKDMVSLILSLLAVPGSSPKAFDSLYFTLGGGVFRYGVLLADVITFVLVAAVVFFVVVRPLQQLQKRRQQSVDPESTDRPCPQCLAEIPKAAVRCRYCTSEVGAVA